MFYWINFHGVCGYCLKTMFFINAGSHAQGRRCLLFPSLSWWKGYVTLGWSFWFIFVLDCFNVLLFEQFLNFYFFHIRIPFIFCLGSIYERWHLSLYEESRRFCSLLFLVILSSGCFNVLIIIGFCRYYWYCGLHKLWWYEICCELFIYYGFIYL